MIRVPRRLGLFVTGLASLFGVRTPPEPDVVPMMSPQKGPTGAAPERDGPTTVQFERARRREPDDPNA